VGHRSPIRACARFRVLVTHRRTFLRPVVRARY
jgi:hypothetical protein